MTNKRKAITALKDSIDRYRFHILIGKILYRDDFKDEDKYLKEIERLTIERKALMLEDRTKNKSKTNEK